VEGAETKLMSDGESRTELETKVEPVNGGGGSKGPFCDVVNGVKSGFFGLLFPQPTNRFSCCLNPYLFFSLDKLDGCVEMERAMVPVVVVEDVGVILIFESIISKKSNDF
jgi:hypothetical protein